MPDHDLIAALAEGRLEPREAAEAERAITADPEAAALLAAHRLALSALGELPDPLLTETERGELRGNIAAAVGLDLSPQRVVQRRKAPWAAISIAAATLAALVAVVPLTGLLNDSGDPAAENVGVAELDDAARTEGGSPAGESDLESAPTLDTSDGDLVSTTAAAMSAPIEESRTLEERLDALIASSSEGSSQERIAPTTETACGMEAEEETGVGLDDLMYAEIMLHDQQAMVFFTVTDGDLAIAAAFSADSCELIDSIP